MATLLPFSTHQQIVRPNVQINFSCLVLRKMLNQVAVEALYSATYLENYLDSVENLPNDLGRHISRMRQLDVDFQGEQSCLDFVSSFLPYFWSIFNKFSLFLKLYSEMLSITKMFSRGTTNQLRVQKILLRPIQQLVPAALGLVTGANEFYKKSSQCSYHP